MTKRDPLVYLALIELFGGLGWMLYGFASAKIVFAALGGCGVGAGVVMVGVRFADNYAARHRRSVVTSK